MTKTYLRFMLVAHLAVAGTSVAAAVTILESAKQMLGEVQVVGQTVLTQIETSMRDAQGTVQQVADQGRERVEDATARAAALMERLENVSTDLRDKLPGVGGVLRREP